MSPMIVSRVKGGTVIKAHCTLQNKNKQKVKPTKKNKPK